MDRDILFKEIDNHLLKSMAERQNKIDAVIKSYSQQKFLGVCSLAHNKMLELTQQDKDRCSFLIEALGLSKIFFGVFSLSYID